VAAARLTRLLRWAPKSPGWWCSLHGQYDGILCQQCVQEELLDDRRGWDRLKSQHPNEAPPRPGRKRL
jgi:hypothetical protein